MDWLESILFGFVSGLTEFLPVSAPAHETLMLTLFGAAATPLLRLAIHGAALLAVYQSLAEYIGAMLRENRLMRIPPRRRKRQPDMVKVLDLRLLTTAAIVLCLGFLAYPTLTAWGGNLNFIAGVLVVNGIILYIPMHMATGNKDSRSMSQLDAVMLGLAGTVAMIPGLSRVGTVTSAGIAQGADREQALRWSLLLSIAALGVSVCMDVYGVMTVGLGSAGVLQTVLAAAAAFGGAFAGIRMMRFMAVRTGFSGFAYYCWGAAMFALIMYLTV